MKSQVVQVFGGDPVLSGMPRGTLNGTTGQFTILPTWIFTYTLNLLSKSVTGSAQLHFTMIMACCRCILLGLYWTTLVCNMAAYAYKYVRDLLPPYFTDEVPGYEGDANYDGDQWSATVDYIEELEKELANQFNQTGSMENQRLLNWLKTRQRTLYQDGPVIKEER